MGITSNFYKKKSYFESKNNIIAYILYKTKTWSVYKLLVIPIFLPYKNTQKS